MNDVNKATYMTPADTSDPAHREINQLSPWFHNLHLPDGTQTAPHHPLGDFPAFKWRDIAPAIPSDLSGWTVLDIGCNAGFYSIELAKRGALVTAIDKDPHFLRQARWAVEQFSLGSRIEIVEAQVYDLASWDRSFDLILFLGVFYHLRYPLLGLDLVAEKTKRLMVFQTLTSPGDAVYAAPKDFSIEERALFSKPGWPTMAFIEHQLAGDATNWWAPNHAAIEAMLRTSGLNVIKRPAHEIYICRPAGDSVASARTFDPSELAAATGAARFASVD
ncbi:MAG TPA: TIGR04290 family methyltransferase [Opitutaceae bacterium]|nr:TIGR04290 family methyltransferase [Opitutaceae bacterium]